MGNLKLWQGSKVGFILGILAGSLLAAGVVYAVTVLREVPAELEVVPRTEQTSGLPIEIYRNPEGTELLEVVRWTGIQRGSRAVTGFFLKNVSSQTLTVRMKVSPNISSWATLDLGPAEEPPGGHPEVKTSYGDYLVLAPGDIGWFWSEITVLLEAPLGPKTFRFQVYTE